MIIKKIEERIKEIKDFYHMTGIDRGRLLIEEATLKWVLEELKKMSCEWKYKDDGYDDYYETACDNLHCFLEGNVKNNQYKYCPYCGRKIIEK